MPGLQLYCLPHSGASAMVYSRWRRHLPAWLAIRPVELPGRGLRMSEPLQRDMVTLVAQLASEIARTIDRSQPYALLGHSLGALLAFELAHALPKIGCGSPVALFASGTAAPTRREDYEEELNQPKTDEELMEDLRVFQGTPEDVLADQELMELTLPIMRSDYLLCGGYHYAHGRQAILTCPLHVLGGKADKASDEQLRAWQQETVAEFSLTMFEGGHFFIREHEEKVLHLIKKNLQPLLNIPDYQYA